MIQHVLRAMGPAIPAGDPREGLRAGFGALMGLLVAGVLVLSFGRTYPGLALIAPFGASAVLIFAVPNSPLAQPWSAIVGNTASAMMAVAICALVADPLIRIPVAVGMAIAVMILLRALHPPGGAVAMTLALNPDLVQSTGLWFAFSPVALGTAVLVGVGVVYGRATGRHYPFRQFDEPSPQGTSDHVAAERLGLSEDDLTAILTRYRQSLNLGVEDLARLIAAAEMTAAGARTGSTVGDIMSRDLVTVGPETALQKIADLFIRHGFTALPVAGPDATFLGVIYQRHLLASAQFRQPDLSGRLRRITGWQDATPMRADQIMTRNGPTAAPDSAVATLLPQMADGLCDAVPVLSHGRIEGIVTRTDLIAALARSSLDTPAG